MRRVNRHKNKRTPHSMKLLNLLTLILLGFVCFTGFKWLQNVKILDAQERAIDDKILEEKNRTKQLLEYQEYMKTDEYIEDIAGSDLGMVYEGDIVFKEIN